MEQLVLLLLFGAIALIQWLVKKSAEMREQRKSEKQAQWREEQDVFREAREVERPAGSQSDDPDASMRKLMEALGLPQEAPPPPVPQRQPIPPPLPQVSATPTPQVRPAQKFADRSSPKVSEKPASKLPEKPFVAAAKLAKSKPMAAVSEKKPDFSIRELLASPDSLKKAVILSEIIGSPKALKS